MNKKNSLANLQSLQKHDHSANELPTEPKKGVGRKAKAAADKAKHPITLKFTDAELETIEKAAGLAPKATFLKSLLLEKTDLFK